MRRAERPIRPDHPLLRWGKWRIIGTFWGVQAAVVFVLLLLWLWQAGTVDGKQGFPLGKLEELWELLEVVQSRGMWILWGLVCLVLMLLQGVLLLPVRRPRARLSRGMPVLLSVGASALCAGLLVVGIVYGVAASLIELHQLTAEVNEYGLEFEDVLLILGAVLVLGWVAAAPLLWVFCSRRLRAGATHEMALHAVASRVFLGTAIEAAAIMPLDIMIRRRTECYCVTGSFAALTVCLGVGLIVLGPMVLLPFIAARRARWRNKRCDACGYDLSDLLTPRRTIERCPECGSGWRGGAGAEPAALVEKP